MRQHVAWANPRCHVCSYTEPLSKLAASEDLERIDGVPSGVLVLIQVEQYLIKTEDIHEDFRLWITAEPHPSFPIGLLQMGIKITNEAPVGMKAGLRASYQWVSQVHMHHQHCCCSSNVYCVEHVSACDACV